MKAVEDLNLLRPEFVVSVGDLIEGYTEERPVVEAQWTEFLGFVEQMQMRFYFVAGNHDVTNPEMHRIWREHFGKEWYSFNHKGVHFVCLSSEDPQSCIGDEQLEWLRRDLVEHEDARWTLVFLHKPLWVYSERSQNAKEADNTNWPAVSALLRGRPHTVFAGHVHSYVQFDRNMTKYYQLATTGGGSLLRGREYGEFDHIVWVTMETDGPHIANILLDGVLPGDVVTEEKILMLQELLARTRLRVDPIRIQETQLTSGSIRVHVSNDFDEEVTVSATVKGIPVKRPSGQKMDLLLKLKPGESVTQELPFRLPHPKAIGSIAQTTVVASVETMGRTPRAVELTMPLVVDRYFPISRVADMRLDGHANDWPEVERLALPIQPVTLGATQQWSGVDDAGLEFSVVETSAGVMCIGEVRDDHVLLEKDQFVIRLDGRSVEKKSPQTTLGPGVFDITWSLSKEDDRPVKVETFGGPMPTEVPAAVFRITENGYRFEVLLPHSLMHSVDWESLLLTIALVDVDESAEGPVYVLWRGARDILTSNRGIGFFLREKLPPSQ